MTRSQAAAPTTLLAALALAALLGGCRGSELLTNSEGRRLDAENQENLAFETARARTEHDRERAELTAEMARLTSDLAARRGAVTSRRAELVAATADLAAATSSRAAAEKSAAESRHATETRAQAMTAATSRMAAETASAAALDQKMADLAAKTAALKQSVVSAEAQIAALGRVLKPTQRALLAAARAAAADSGSSVVELRLRSMDDQGRVRLNVPEGVTLTGGIDAVVERGEALMGSIAISGLQAAAATAAGEVEGVFQPADPAFPLALTDHVWVVLSGADRR